MITGHYSALVRLQAWQIAGVRNLKGFIPNMKDRYNKVSFCFYFTFFYVHLFVVFFVLSIFFCFYTGKSKEGSPGTKSMV